ncbi:MAG: hypothetical protein LBJ18_03515 [Rickettsiales bacterium]|jgi:hypothetical protein|nr:hypothetical protein [Rickettsiales bacterium]
MSQKTRKYENKKHTRKNGSLFWLMGIAAVLSFGKAKAQNQPDQKTSLKQQVESIYANPELFSNVASFIEKLESPGPKLNEDSIYSLSNSKFMQFISDVKKRDPRIQTETTVFETDAEVLDFLNNQNIPMATFQRNLNLITLNLFKTGTKVNKRYANLFDAINREQLFYFSHEFKHSQIMNNIKLGRLDFSQLLEYQLCNELASEGKRLLDKIKAIQLTGRFQDGFPSQSNDIALWWNDPQNLHKSSNKTFRETSTKYSAGEVEFPKKDLAKIAGLREFAAVFGDHTILAKHLIQKRSDGSGNIKIKELDQKDADAIALSLLDWLDRHLDDFSGYTIPKNIEWDITESQINIGKSEELSDFSEFLHEMFDYDGFNLLDAVSDSLRKKMMLQIEQYVKHLMENPEIQSVRDNNSEILDAMKENKGR